VHTGGCVLIFDVSYTRHPVHTLDGMSNDTATTLRYFSCRGRAEPLRMMLHDTGTPFNDHAVGPAAIPSWHMSPLPRDSEEGGWARHLTPSSPPCMSVTSHRVASHSLHVHPPHARAPPGGPLTLVW